MTASRKRVRMPPKPLRTKSQERAEERDAERAVERAKAGRVAFRVLMARGHGCTGKTCKAPEHDEHLKDRLMVALMALEVIPDPGAQWLPGPGYAAAKYRKRKKGAK